MPSGSGWFGQIDKQFEGSSGDLGFASLLSLGDSRETLGGVEVRVGRDSLACHCLSPDGIL